jgi:hypothetical protein
MAQSFYARGGLTMQRKKVPAGHHRFGLARLVLVLALLFLVVALTTGLAGCLFQPVLAARGTLLFLPGK